jgi:hypothetical protein
MDLDNKEKTMAKKPAGKKLPPWMMEDKDEMTMPMDKGKMPMKKKGKKAPAKKGGKKAC